VRRLAAIMFIDTVGYTASTQADEGRTLHLLRQQADLVRPIVAVHQGREIKSTGDGFLVEFDSALKATHCAVNIQRLIHERNAEGGLIPIQIRIGIHLGDVVARGTDILGDAVNIAARIEPIAEPGGICVSAAVYEQVQNKIPDKLEKLAPTALKGLEAPVDIYRVVLPWAVRESPTDASAPTGIAILPFSNISPDPRDEYFADGLTEELISVISQVRELRVISRTSVMQFKATTKAVSQIGKELGVSSILEGSVRKAGNRLRITAQLIDARSDRHLWAKTYERELDDVFAIQAEIAKQVADALKIELRAPEEAPLKASLPVPELKKTEDTQAYLYFLQGQALVWQRAEEPLRQALSFFEQAVERDPSFSRAYAGKARGYIELGSEGLIPFSEAIERGKAATEKALSISPDLAEAHSLLAELSFMADDPLEVREKEARRAVELNPNLAEAYGNLGVIEGQTGDLRAYVSHSETAYQLDPLSPLAIRDLGRAYFYSGREQDALEHWKRTLHLDPINSYRWMTDYYIAKGDLEKAGAMVKELERIGPTNEFTYLNRGYLAALKGDNAIAREMIAKLDTTHEQGWARGSFAGFIYLALGDVDKFFEYMIVSAKDHTLRAIDLMFSPLFAEVRKDPRFEQLFCLVGLKLQPTV
jgi:adenylate cyclase